LPQIDWLKIDSQGTDLRIFDGLNNEVRSKVLALDIEPGLIHAYRGEDLFVHAHDYLLKNGFWLSDLKVSGAVRMRKQILEGIKIFEGNDLNMAEKIMKKSPAWVNARYFRTAEWLVGRNFPEQSFVTLWTFALLDDQLGFAIELGADYEKCFGRNDIAMAMKNIPLALISRKKKSLQLRSLALQIRQRIGRFLRRYG